MSWDILPKGNLQYFLQKLKVKFDLKVDKEAGKGLSSNDFTTEEKNKLSGIEEGAQVNPTIDSALSDSSTNAVQNKVVKGALDSKAGREEIPDVNNNTITIQLNGVTVESFTLNQATDETINIQVTKSSVGLGNVPNVATNDQTPTFTKASTRSNIASGEKLSVIFGKIMKWFADLKTVAFSGSYSDLSNQPTLGTASAKDVPASGNASTSQVVMGNDTRLTDSRPASDVYSWAKAATKPTYTKAEIGLGNVDNTADANKNVKYATCAGSAAKGTNNKFETTFLTLGSNGNEPTVTAHNSVSGDGTLKVGFNPNDTAMGSSGRNLYLPIGSMYSSNQATLATVEYLNSNLITKQDSVYEAGSYSNMNTTAVVQSVCAKLINKKDISGTYSIAFTLTGTSMYMGVVYLYKPANRVFGYVFPQNFETPQGFMIFKYENGSITAKKVTYTNW